MYEHSVADPVKKELPQKNPLVYRPDESSAAKEFKKSNQSDASQLFEIGAISCGLVVKRETIIAASMHSFGQPIIIGLCLVFQKSVTIVLQPLACSYNIGVKKTFRSKHRISSRELLRRNRPDEKCVVQNSSTLSPRRDLLIPFIQLVNSRLNNYKSKKNVLIVR